MQQANARTHTHEDIHIHSQYQTHTHMHARTRAIAIFTHTQTTIRASTQINSHFRLCNKQVNLCCVFVCVNEVVWASLKFYQSVCNGSLEPDMQRTTPLCMHQYTRLFGTGVYVCLCVCFVHCAVVYAHTNAIFLHFDTEP